MSVIDNSAIPKGSTILITGASGWVGSNVADQFLAFGYKVRGTTRDIAKASWMHEVFSNKYGSGTFELVSVPDMAAVGAYDEVIKGVSAVVHTASIMPEDPNPKNVIPAVIAGSINALKAAFSEPSVKRFVLTSSSSAALHSIRDRPKIIATSNTWNEEAVKIAWSDPPYDALHPLFVYVASKTQGEQAVWKFYNENHTKRPDLILNTVLPNMVFGKTLDFDKQGYPSSAGFVSRLYKGELSAEHQFVDPQYFIDSSDVGRLHVAGAVHPDVRGERIFGFAGRFSWDNVLSIFRKHDPDNSFVENFSGGEDPNEILPAARAEQLLRDLGQPGWTSLEHCILRNIEDIRAAPAA